MVRQTAILAAILLVTVTASVPAGAHSNDTTRVNVTKTVDDADTYVFTLDSTRPFNLKSGSYIEVKANFGSGGSIDTQTSGASCCSGPGTTRGIGLAYQPGPGNPQDAGALYGILEKGHGCGYCTFRMIGDSLKDVGDARIQEEVLDVEFEQDSHAVGYDAFRLTMQWQNDDWFPGPSGSQSERSWNMFVTIPGAESLEVDVHIHANAGPIPHEDSGPAEVTWRDASDRGGFLRTTEDFDSTAQADTMPAEAIVQGQTTFDFLPAEPDDLLYHYMSPAWFGTTVVSTKGIFFSGPVYAATANTASAGSYGVQDPKGNTVSGYGLAVAQTSGAIATGLGLPGTYTYFVDHQVGVGPTDMYVVGYVGNLNR